VLARTKELQESESLRLSVDKGKARGEESKVYESIHKIEIAHNYAEKYDAVPTVSYESDFEKSATDGSSNVI
jgi:hypothetical protein